MNILIRQSNILIPSIRKCLGSTLLPKASGKNVRFQLLYSSILALLTNLGNRILQLTNSLHWATVTLLKHRFSPIPKMYLISKQEMLYPVFSTNVSLPIKYSSYRVVCQRIILSNLLTDSAAAIWKSVSSVSSAGRRRGRGKNRGKKIIKDLNKGQVIGIGELSQTSVK